MLLRWKDKEIWVGGGGGSSKDGKSRRMFMQILNFDQTIEEVSE